MTSDTAAIRIRGVAHQFGEAGDARHVRALRDTSLDIARGELLCLIGPSGCGKSTLLNVIAGFLPASGGAVTVDGRPVIGPGLDRGVVFQSAEALFPWLTARQNVEYGPRRRGVPAPERAAAAGRYLEMVGLRHVVDRFPDELSGGMRQRVQLARVLVNQPPVVLMDEPFGALDPQTRWGMQGLLLDVAKSEDNTTLFVTHDVSEAVYLADTVYVLSPRPARILHAVPVPTFRERDFALKSAPEFRAVEKQLLDLLYTTPAR